MNILIIDDHPLSRHGTAEALRQGFEDVKQVFEAGNAEEAMKIARRETLNLVILDLHLGHSADCEGMQLLTDLKQEFGSLCVVVHSGYDHQWEWVFESIQKGAMGFLPKNLSTQEFNTALKTILHDGCSYLPAGIVWENQALPVSMSRVSNILSELTPRQIEVLRWVVQGYTVEAIACELDIKPQTVKNHLRPIFDIFGVQSRLELIVTLNRKVVFGLLGIGNSATKRKV